jgi:glycerol-3-phosphate acyltransferase PlsX
VDIITALRRATISADTMGGGPLLGVNGVVFKAHGRSKAPEVATTIGTAKRMVEVDLVGTFKSELQSVRSKLNIPSANV